MTVRDVLVDKLNQLKETGNPVNVEFTVDDINTLSDINALRCFSLQEPFPDNYIPDKDPFACSRNILAGDSIYRVMELCLMKNRALQNSIPIVFNAWRRNNV